MRTKIRLDLDLLAVATFETAQTPPPAPANEQIRTCLNTACPPYVCCA
jgi:hypothetical protein